MCRVRRNRGGRCIQRTTSIGGQMKTALKGVGGVLLVGAIAGGSYTAGAVLQPPEVRIVTETNEVEVPGPVRWKTKRVPFVPAACTRAVEAGNDMADVVDDYGNEVV